MYRNLLKSDLDDIKHLMEYKVSRDSFLLLGDTVLEAAKELHEVRPEFTIDPPWKRKRRPPYPEPPLTIEKYRALSNIKPRWDVWEEANGPSFGLFENEVS